MNTGIPVITGTGLEQEIGLLQSWGLTETHLTKTVFNAARSAFLDDKKKKELQKELRKVRQFQFKLKPTVGNYRRLVWKTKLNWRS